MPTPTRITAGLLSAIAAYAYWLLDTLRRWLHQVGVAPVRLDMLRLRLLKIGAGCTHTPRACVSIWRAVTGPSSP